MKYKKGDIVYLRPWEELRKQKGFQGHIDCASFDDDCGYIERDDYEHFFGKPLTVTDYSKDDRYEVPICYRFAAAEGYSWWFGEAYVHPVQKKIKYFNRRG